MLCLCTTRFSSRVTWERTWATVCQTAVRPLGTSTLERGVGAMTSQWFRNTFSRAFSPRAGEGSGRDGNESDSPHGEWAELPGDGEGARRRGPSLDGRVSVVSQGMVAASPVGAANTGTLGSLGSRAPASPARRPSYDPDSIEQAQLQYETEARNFPFP